MNRSNRCVFALVTILLVGPSARTASAQTLYGITGGPPGAPSVLYTINTATGAGTLVTNVTPGFPTLSMAFRGTSLYAWDTSVNRLRQLDLVTGNSLAVIDIGIASLIEGLAFRSDGIGFAAQRGTAPFYSFDVTVPSSTAITPSMNPGMRGIAFGPTGVLYGISSNGTELRTINPATGATTLIGMTGIPTGAGDWGDLACDASGVLFTVISPSNPTPSTLYRINAATGAGTLVGNIGFHSAGIAFQTGGPLPPPVPPPTPPPSPTPGPVPTHEGSFAGSASQSPGVEGTFGLGARMAASLPRITFPRLAGPFTDRANPSSVRVYNVSHRKMEEFCSSNRQAEQTTANDFAWAPAIGMLLGLTAVLAAVRIARHQV